MLIFQLLDLDRMLIWQFFFLWKSAIYHSIKLPFDAQVIQKILNVIWYTAVTPAPLKPKAYPLHLKTIHTKNAKKVKKNRVSKVKSCWPEKMDISDTSRLSNSCSSNATTMGLNPFWNSFHNFIQLRGTAENFNKTTATV